MLAGAGQVLAGEGGFRIKMAQLLRKMQRTLLGTLAPPMEPRPGLKSLHQCEPTQFFPKPPSVLIELQGGQNPRAVIRHPETC